MVKKEDNIPLKYIPKYLSNSDRKKQKKNIEQSKTSYKNKEYIERPKLDSYSHKSSKHLEKVKQIYGEDPLIVNDSLAKKTGCSKEGLEKIKNKGRGAYYSSGSRPNQTAESWAVPRLASAITGGPSSTFDYHILNEHCEKNSKALALAKKTCKKMNKCQKYLQKNKSKKQKTNKQKTQKNKNNKNSD